MSVPGVALAHASALVTYFWHYTLARLLYDELVWPILDGRLPVIVLVAGLAGLLLLFGRRRRRRS